MGDVLVRQRKKRVATGLSIGVMDGSAEPVTETKIPRPKTSVALSSESEEETSSSSDETAYLLRSPTNASRLLAAIRDLEAGRGRERELIDAPDLL